MTTQEDSNIEQLQEIITNTWLLGDYYPPSIVLAHEPVFDTWYLVADDSTPIIELVDETGAVFIAEKSKCQVEDIVYICQQVAASHDFPITDRQYFVRESIVPLLGDKYNLT